MYKTGVRFLFEIFEYNVCFLDNIQRQVSIIKNIKII